MLRVCASSIVQSFIVGWIALGNSKQIYSTVYSTIVD